MELHLAGGCHRRPRSRRPTCGELREQAAGLPVEFHPNAERGDARASSTRGARCSGTPPGHGETQPERFEHFGITTVEAMAYGCVPIVPALGGQLEIVGDGRNGRLWRSGRRARRGSTAELIEDGGDARRWQRRRSRDAARFGKECFLARVREELLSPPLPRPTTRHGSVNLPGVPASAELAPFEGSSAARAAFGRHAAFRVVQRVTVPLRRRYLPVRLGGGRRRGGLPRPRAVARWAWTMPPRSEARRLEIGGGPHAQRGLPARRHRPGRPSPRVGGAGLGPALAGRMGQ